MTKTKILERDAPLLRETAKPVPIKSIGSKNIQNIIERMKEAVHVEEDGVAIAAPQIGESLRIFVVNGKALALAKKVKIIDHAKEFGDLVFINPEIIKYSQRKIKPNSKDGVYEGCLSIPHHYAPLERSSSVTVKYLDTNFKSHQKSFSGFAAHIVQHEIDHLNGILFIDRVLEQNAPLFKLEGKTWHEVTF